MEIFNAFLCIFLAFGTILHCFGTVFSQYVYRSNENPNEESEMLDELQHQDIRIVGGQRLAIDQVPFQALIRQRLDHTTSVQCGAILVHSQWILSAAHCLKDDNIQSKPIDIFLGVSRLSQIPDPGPSQSRTNNGVNPQNPRTNFRFRGRNYHQRESDDKAISTPEEVPELSAIPTPLVSLHGRVLFIRHDRWNWNFHMEHILDNHRQGPAKIVVHRAVQVFRAPPVNYANGTSVSDLILVKLDRPVQSSNTVRPIELPEFGWEFSRNQMAFASGFGATYFSDKETLHPSNNLQYTRIPILNKNQCVNMFRGVFDDWESVMPYVEPESILCAGYPEGGRDSCIGDSGGPLAVCLPPLQQHQKHHSARGSYIWNPDYGRYAEDFRFKRQLPPMSNPSFHGSPTTFSQRLCPSNRWQLAGIISLGFRCAEPGIPGLYTNVALFSDWIKSIIE